MALDALDPSQWRHNERNGVSNRQRLGCFPNLFFGGGVWGGGGGGGGGGGSTGDFVGQMSPGLSQGMILSSRTISKSRIDRKYKCIFICQKYSGRKEVNHLETKRFAFATFLNMALKFNKYYRLHNVLKLPRPLLQMA